MEEEKVVDVERKLVGRIPYQYKLDTKTTTLEADSGFGRVGAKMDPATGALMYDRYEDWITKERSMKEEVKKSSIRFSEDSGAMIQFRETEEARLGVDGDLKTHMAKGVLSVINRSEKDRIWDISVGLETGAGIARLDFGELNFKEIEAGERESREYGIDLHEPSIALEEAITTHPDLPESRVLLKGRPSHIQLQVGLKNLAVIPYKDLIISKPIPEQLKNVVFPGDTAEDVAIDNGKLIWRIPHLEPGDMRILRYEGDIDTRTNDSIPTGDLRMKATGEDLITNIIVNSFDAMCRNMYFIEADETDEPGEWVCRFVVENTSQFEVEVLRVEVKDPRSDKVYLNLENPEIFVPPSGRWESDNWLIRGSERPSFIKNLILNVVPGLSKKIEYGLLKEGGDFYPAGLSFKKSFDKRKVEAKRDTEVGAQLTIENTGFADIEQVFVRDSLPAHFLPPQPGSISVEKAGVPLRDNVGIHVEPDSGDPMDHQQFFIRIDDLSSYSGPLKSGERLLIKYRTLVHRPEPEDKMTAPAEVDARSLLPGPVISGEDVAGAPVIETQQVLRRFSVGKSIEQGSRPGEYHIEILYRNRGNNPVLDLVLKDIIPENFKGSGYSMDPIQDQTPEGVTVLEWKLPKVEPGQSALISYSINGEGEYHPTDAQIFYNASD